MTVILNKSHDPRSYRASLAMVALAATVNCSDSENPPRCEGTNEADTIHGTPERDLVLADGGNDRVYGYGGSDAIGGGEGYKRIHGGADIDRVGNDKGRIVGGCGRDILTSWGTARIFAGRGADTIRAHNEAPNEIDCGRGGDTVYLDRGLDELEGCEECIPRAPVPVY